MARPTASGTGRWEDKEESDSTIACGREVSADDARLIECAARDGSRRPKQRSFVGGQVQRRNALSSGEMEREKRVVSWPWTGWVRGGGRMSKIRPGCVTSPVPGTREHL